VVARRTKDTPDGFVGHDVISGNLAQGFVVFNDTADHVGPLFRWDAIVRLAWTCMLLCGDERGKTAEQVLERKQPVIELTMRSNKVNQHW
jgi:hypothetical protein